MHGNRKSTQEIPSKGGVPPAQASHGAGYPRDRLLPLSPSSGDVQMPLRPLPWQTLSVGDAKGREEPMDIWKAANKALGHL